MCITKTKQNKTTHLIKIKKKIETLQRVFVDRQHIHRQRIKIFDIIDHQVPCHCQLNEVSLIAVNTVMLNA